MAKKKIQKTNAIRLLEQKKIPYTEREFEVTDEHTDAVSVAHALGQKEEEIFKTLVTLGNKTGPVVVAIPGNHELDLKKLAKVSGNKKMEMLPLKDLEQTTGYIRGGCSPVGMKKLYPTYFDQSALEHDSIHVSAGKRGVQMSVAPQALAQLVRGEFHDLIV
ncbi:Cys-tRNA(Pro) deacylase [Vagococcus coleopterorum]|uniref:Cys-tRNA(Pro)/Cys-tRNA(Cys) deacylase n=1 Tax=Vagococcus coleopterorum TaxID=2714946 RepID=A0A6G8AMF6_9ENTE|nr:Cys-tRNA(Pro) deacylase [Vagococcus coleopterorum]QIL46261.1 Cys-tRNA(Pro) deacylase [Vagococcus coleopterorum]